MYSHNASYAGLWFSNYIIFLISFLLCLLYSGKEDYHKRMLSGEPDLDTQADNTMRGKGQPLNRPIPDKKKKAAKRKSVK